jgi:hypothetical protein
MARAWIFAYVEYLTEVEMIVAVAMKEKDCSKADGRSAELKNAPV